MKITIITFSPSGNTEKIGQLIKKKLALKDIKIQYINLSKETNYFKTENKEKYIREIIKSHDILIIGSPVYANHLQYNIKELISVLPKPTNGFSEIAIPFVTYGGIASGIALEEAGKLLKKSGRKILLGAKFAMSHRMTRGFMDTEFDISDSNEINHTIEEMVDKVCNYNLEDKRDSSKALVYQSRLMYIKANIIFNEKKWHKNRYPKIKIKSEDCSKCGACIKCCPVNHLIEDLNGNIIHGKSSECIHCFNCIANCPNKAIYPEGDLNKARKFMEKKIGEQMENPASKIYMK